MLKNFVVAAPLMLTLTASVPSNVMAESHTYTGRVTARSETSISVYDKEIITIALDNGTTVVPWVREKPFVRKTTYLTPSEVRVGSPVAVTTRSDSNVADVVKVASDVRKWFSGRVVAYSDSSLSVYDTEMAVVKLAVDSRTSFTELFTVKPWVRKTVHLTSGDLNVGSFVNVFPSKLRADVAERVEIAKGMPLVVPPSWPAKTAACCMTADSLDFVR
jgi:hypothetical protein